MSIFSTNVVTSNAHWGKKLDSYIEKLVADYEVWYEQEQKEKQAAYEEKLRNGVPL